MTDDDFIKLFQRRAAEAGHNVGVADGIVGKRTLEVLDKLLPPLVILPRPEIETGLDDIPDAGDKKLEGVHPVLASLIRESSLRSATPFTVIEGLRTKARQAQLVKAGASKTQNSRHLTGHAVDLWPLDKDGKALPSDAAFKRGSNEARAASAALWSALRAISTVVKEVARERGIMIEWGGDWGWDAPHFQLNRRMYPDE